MKTVEDALEVYSTVTGEFTGIHAESCAADEEGLCEPMSGEWPDLDPYLILDVAYTAPDGAEFCQIIEIARSEMGEA